jgi:hypothetical protein
LYERRFGHITAYANAYLPGGVNAAGGLLRQRCIHII